MKKLTSCIMTSFLLLSFFPTQLKAATSINESATVSTVDNATVETKTAVSADMNTDNVAEAASSKASLSWRRCGIYRRRHYIADYPDPFIAIMDNVEIHLIKKIPTK